MKRFISCFVFAIGCSGATSGVDDPDKTTSGGEPGVCGDGMIEGDEPCDGMDLGGTACADLPGFSGGTLACRADCSAFDVSACEADPMAAVVRINEVTSTEIADGTYAGAGDAVELYNAGMAPADLSGLQLADDPEFPAEDTYVFPPGITLEPGAFLVLTKVDEVTGDGDYTFGISSTDPEALHLGDAGGSILDTVTFSGADAEVSWCRVPDGDGDWQHCERTFGAPNMVGEPTTDTGPEPICGDAVRNADEDCDGEDLGGATCLDVGDFADGRLACARDCTYDTDACEPVLPANPLVLNEITSSGDEAIELYNASGRAIDLEGWIVTDELSAPRDAYDPDADPERVEFGAGVTIGAGEFLVVLAGDPPGHAFGLAASGDHVALLDPSLAVVDFVEYAADEAAVSYCRVPDGPFGAWEPNCTATPGEPNAR